MLPSVLISSKLANTTMTYSIVARDLNSAEIGVAVASRFFAVGSLVPHVRHNIAMATQAFVNPMWGV
ncbi:MAG: putative Ntn-hydrolase superfamily protein, partial [Gammaproteobacteria bacterium]